MSDLPNSLQNQNEKSHREMAHDELIRPSMNTLEVALALAVETIYWKFPRIEQIETLTHYPCVPLTTCETAEQIRELAYELKQLIGVYLDKIGEKREPFTHLDCLYEKIAP